MKRGDLVNVVEPIRDINKVEEMHTYLLNQDSKEAKRDALFLSTGVYTGLRISDVRLFRVADALKRTYNIREKKTGKQKIYEWNPYLWNELQEYIKGKNPNEFLFKSRKGFNQPISRVRAYQIIKKAGTACGIDNIGTHSLRKTFGYHMYKKTKDVAMLMDIFNHSSPEITLRYIGVSTEKSNNSMKKMKFF